MVLSNPDLFAPLRALHEGYFDMNFYGPLFDSLFVCDKEYVLHRREKHLQSIGSFRDERKVIADGVVTFSVSYRESEILIMESSPPADQQHYRGNLIKLGHSMKAALYQLMFSRKCKRVIDYVVYGILTNGRCPDFA